MSCISMPVETAPDWFQLLLLCCLDSGILHSLGEEKAHGSERMAPHLSSSVGSMLQGGPVVQGAPHWLRDLACLGKAP